jgi:hypothetical protein
MQRIPVEAEYMSNPSDVIDEEEFEDSENDPASPLKKHGKFHALNSQKNPSSLTSKTQTLEPKPIPSYMQSTKATQKAPEAKPKPVNMAQQQKPSSANQ